MGKNSRFFRNPSPRITAQDNVNHLYNYSYELFPEMLHEPTTLLPVRPEVDSSRQTRDPPGPPESESEARGECAGLLAFRTALLPHSGDGESTSGRVSGGKCVEKRRGWRTPHGSRKSHPRSGHSWSSPGPGSPSPDPKMLHDEAEKSTRGRLFEVDFLRESDSGQGRVGGSGTRRDQGTGRLDSSLRQRAVGVSMPSAHRPAGGP